MWASGSQKTHRPEGDAIHGAGDERVSIHIVAREPDAIHLVGVGPAGQIEVIAGVRVEPDTLVLTSLHIDGSGEGSFGRRGLLALARELGRQEAVKRVRIFGARRTTGAHPGHLPRVIEIEVV